MAEKNHVLAEQLGAKVVGKVPDTGGGAFGAARLGHIVATRQFAPTPTTSGTSLSLLDACLADPDSPRWSDLYAIYRPLIRNMAIRGGVHHNEADDVVTRTLLAIRKSLPNFKRGASGSFRAWIRRIVYNRIHEYRRSQHKLTYYMRSSPIDELADDNSEISRFFDREHAKSVAAVAWDFIEQEIENHRIDPIHAAAFRLKVCEEMSSKDIAAKLGIKSPNLVDVYKYRLLKRLRDHFQDLAEID